MPQIVITKPPAPAPAPPGKPYDPFWYYKHIGMKSPNAAPAAVVAPAEPPFVPTFLPRTGKTGVLQVGPVLAEFGWELSVAAMARKRAHGYERVIVSTRPSRNALYADFATDFRPHDIECECAFVWPCRDAVVDYSRIGALIVKGAELMPITIYNPFLPDQREYVGYGKFDQQYEGVIVLHARNRKHIPARNWPAHKWAWVVDELRKAGVTERFVCIGHPGSAFAIPGCDDLRGIDLAEQMNVLRSAKAAMGASSGPMHLASLCGSLDAGGCPHMVWCGGEPSESSSTIKYYEKLWNPFGTKVLAYARPDWNPEKEMVLAWARDFLAELPARREPEPMVLVVMSTIPSRADGLNALVGNLLAQDLREPYALHICYDGFKEVPARSTALARLSASGVRITEEAFPDGPSGTTRRLRAVGQHPGADIVAFMDDDIVYPPDYLSTGVRELRKAADDVATVTFHGKVWRSRGFRDFYRVSFDCACDAEQSLHAPGVGVSFSRAPFVRSLVEREDFGQFAYACDLLFGFAAWQQGKGVVALPHKAGWLRNFREYDDAVWVARHVEQGNIFASMVERGWRGL